MAQYNGHRSWNAWNVSLWINNDESLYQWAYDLMSQHGLRKAAYTMNKELKGKRTPDGARYNLTCIKEAIKDIL